LIRPWEKLVLGQKYNEVLTAHRGGGDARPMQTLSRSFSFISLFLSFFSQLGAVRFDRDLRAITTYLSSQTAFGDVRSKFVRLQQIATLLNLDHVRPVLTLFFPFSSGVILMVVVRSFGGVFVRAK
jgi:hypothetical protein